eukprot:tig00020943_g16279.t1
MAFRRPTAGLEEIRFQPPGYSAGAPGGYGAAYGAPGGYGPPPGAPVVGGYGAPVVAGYDVPYGAPPLREPSRPGQPIAAADASFVPLDVVIEFPWGQKYIELEPEAAGAPQNGAPVARRRGSLFLVNEEQQRREIIDHIQNRRATVNALRAIGLTITKITTDSEYYIKVGATDAVLMKAAEVMQLPMNCRQIDDPKFNKMSLEGIRPFKRSEAEFFHPAPNSVSFFSSTDRIRILQFLLEAPKFRGGAALDFESLIKNGHVVQWFPLHDMEHMKQLSQKWFAWRSPFSSLPIDECREYFGESVAFYFAFVDTYNRWLAILSIIGIIAAIFQYTNRSNPVLVRDAATGISHYEQPIAYDSWITGPFCVLVACGAALFTVHWTRVQARFRFRWGMTDLETRERDRPGYEGTGKSPDGTDAGCFADETTWVGFEENMPQSFFQRWLRRFPPAFASQFIWRRHARPRHEWRIVSLVVTMVCIACVWTVVFSLLGLRAFLQHAFSPLVASVVVGPSITVFTQLSYFGFNRVAHWLTDKQNWRKQSSWDNSYVFKIFLFQFVTGYASYFFIISVKAWEMELLPGAKERCLPAVTNGPPNCMYDLSYALLSIFTFQLLIGNVQENIIPYLKYKWQKWSTLRRATQKREQDMRQGLVPMDQLGPGPAGRPSMKSQLGETIAEANRNTFTCALVDDYAELMLQFGLVTMFAAGFPLSAALALLNNLIEIRSDMFKFLNTMQRPFPAMAQGIGVWNWILFGMSTVAVTTNSFILGFVSTTLNDYFNGWKHPFVSKLCFIVLVEHCVLISQLLIHFQIHQVPKTVRIRAALEVKVAELEERLEEYELRASESRSSLGFGPAAAAAAHAGAHLRASARPGQFTEADALGYESPEEDQREGRARFR